MTRPTPPKKRRFFFRKTRELGEKEWDLGIRTNPIRRLFRARKGLEALQRIQEQQKKSKEFEPRLEKFSQEAGFTPMVFLQPHSHVNGTLAARVLETIGAMGRSRLLFSNNEKIYYFRGGHTPAELGNVAMRYDPAQREMNIQVHLTTNGVLVYGDQFPSNKWKRTLSKETGLSTYTWKETIPQEIIDAAVEWRKARVSSQIDLDRYQKEYARKHPKKKPLPKR